MTAFPAAWPAPPRAAMEGRYARLEPLDPDRHGDDLFAAVTGPEADRLHLWLPEPPPPSRAAFRDWLVAKAALSDPLYFAVIDRATGRVAGRQTLMDIQLAHGTAEIGHILWGPAMAGTRLATEAFFLQADLAMTGLAYRRYQWKCNARNEPSRRAALRFGFRFEGVFRNHMVVKGQNRDTAWYSITDAEWPALRAGYLAWLSPENFDAEGRQRRRLEELRAGGGTVATPA